MPKDELRSRGERKRAAKKANAAKWAKAVARAKRLAAGKSPVSSSRPHCWVPYEMPFGKHKGLTLDLVPRDYLEWLLRQEFLRAELRSILVSFLYSGGRPLMNRPATEKPKQFERDAAAEPTPLHSVPRPPQIPPPPWL